MKRLLGTSVLALSAILLGLPSTGFSQLTGYWPLDEITGGTTANLAPGGTAANVFGGVTVFNDPLRGNNVFEFNGATGSYVNAGSIPTLGANTPFTWSFWGNSLNNGNGNNLLVGNRYNPSGGEFNPREFIKFTPTKFEFHFNGASVASDYADLVLGEWHHHAIVKDGNALVYLRDGIVTGINRVTGGLNNSQPLYFGGNNNTENWNGRLDNVATWTSTVPLSSVSAIAKGSATPLTAAATFTTQVAMSDNFNGASLDTSKWTATNRGLENNAAVGYNGPTVVGGGVSGSNALQLGGAPSAQYWYGDSIESNQTFSGNLESLVSVQRMSLTKTGVAARSSLWIYGDDGHFLHFSQNLGEFGWSWNARDDGGTGTLNPVGNGNNITLLDSLDNDAGQHKMSIRIASAGDVGDYNFLMYLDDQVVASHFVSNFPDTFRVILTGQARTIGDSGLAVFDDFQVLQQVPEPTAGVLLLAATGLFAIRRRTRATA